MQLDTFFVMKSCMKESKGEVRILVVVIPGLVSCSLSQLHLPLFSFRRMKTSYSSLRPIQLKDVISHLHFDASSRIREKDGRKDIK